MLSFVLADLNWDPFCSEFLLCLNEVRAVYAVDYQSTLKVTLVESKFESDGMFQGSTFLSFVGGPKIRFPVREPTGGTNFWGAFSVTGVY